MNNPTSVEPTSDRTPRGFVAYPYAGDIPEIFRNAIKEINQGQTVNLVSWEDTKVDGSIVIDVIFDHIRTADFFVADLTGINLTCPPLSFT
jgi:hypothetical protein